MEIKRETLKIFRKDFEEAMKALEVKHNINISVGKITFTSEGFTGRMTCKNPINLTQTLCEQSATPFANEVVPGAESSEQKKFVSQCVMFGFKAEDYMMPLRHNGKTYFLTGFKPNSPKNCCRVKNDCGGKEYVTSAEWVRANKSLFGATVVPPMPPMQLHTRRFTNENDAEQAAEYAHE